MGKHVLTRRQILQFHNAIQGIGPLCVGPKWGYATARNLERTEKVAKAFRVIQEFGKDNEEFKEYEKKRLALITSLAVGPGGKSHTIVQGGNPVRAVHPDRMGEFVDGMDKLRAEYKDLVQQMEAHVKRVEEILDEPEEIWLFGVRPEDVPEGLTQDQYNALWPQVDAAEVPGTEKEEWPRTIN